MQAESKTVPMYFALFAVFAVLNVFP